MNNQEREEHIKKVLEEFEAYQRRLQEEEERRAQIRKGILEEIACKKAELDEKQIREQLKMEGLLPVTRRIYFRDEAQTQKSIIEASGGAGGIQLKIFGRLPPQARRTLGASLVRSMKPILLYLREFDLHHQEAPLSMKRLRERALNLPLSPDLHSEAGRIGFEIRMKRLKIGWTQHELAERASVNSKHLSDIELGRVRVRWRTLQRLERALADILSDESKD